MIFLFSCSIIMLQLLSQNVYAKDENILPTWATPEEFSNTDKRVATRRQSIFRLGVGSNFRAPAEFEPIAAVLMTYAYFEDLLNEISVSIAQSGAEVWMVGGPDEGIPGVPRELYKKFDLEYDSNWFRDYGPIGLKEKSTEEIVIVDTVYRHYSRLADDNIPCSVADEMGVSCYKSALTVDGGNIMVDGKGNLFMTDITYDWNYNLSKERVDKLLKEYFGVHTIHSFPYAKAPPEHYWYLSNGSTPADGTGHIDMFAKIVSPCKVIISKSDDETFRQVFEDVAEYFNDLQCDDSETGFYEVYRIQGWYNYNEFVWYTYTNSLIVNDIVIVPSYKRGHNEAAMSVYNVAMPNHRVVSHNTDKIIQYGGSIHCLTRDIPM